MKREFHNLYSHGFIRVAACSSPTKVADPGANAAAAAEMVQEAWERRAVLAVFPELSLSSSSGGDLYLQESLLDASLEALCELREAAAPLPLAVIAGVPLRVEGGIFNCAALIFGGRVLGLAVKSWLSAGGDSPSSRQFRPVAALRVDRVDLPGQRGVPIGDDLIFEAEGIPGLRLFCEIGDDLLSPLPPSASAVLAGASVVAVSGSSRALPGGPERRRRTASELSARQICGLVYAGAGEGESTTDFVRDGHCLIAEAGEILAETEPYSKKPAMALADMDLGRICHARAASPHFGLPAEGRPFRRIVFPLEAPSGSISLIRPVPPFPYVPADRGLRDEICRETCLIQARGLASRRMATGIKNLVLGVSGGLDSTLALIVCAMAMDLLSLPRINIKAFSLPGFATSERTAATARLLMEALGAEGAEIDIRPGCMQMLRDMGHPFADGEKVYDVAFENVQAGQRTSLLFRIANDLGGMVVGTGDMSELALGWCTYGVGDHMSHYSVNCGVPKTLVRAIIRHAADEAAMGEAAGAAFEAVLATEISPELVPGAPGAAKNGGPAQSTEAAIGPYELQDFNLFYTLERGCSPSKIAFLARAAWGEKYSLAEIKKWLSVFVRRFFGTSQFKRSCAPDGPAVFAGSLSPRTGHCAPSDGRATPWEDDLKSIPD
ncbi:MAG: NAD(+) synthase [Synergistaceae bacterium]|nr:NAD(+) synthase [Synergistaceae bacterium]